MSGGEDDENRARLTNLKEGMEPDGQRHLQDRVVVMEGSWGLAYDDPWSDSDAIMTGDGCLQGAMSPPSTWGPGTPCLEAVEVHMSEAELEGL